MTLFPVSNPYDAGAAENGPRDLLGPPYGDNKEATAATDVLVSLRFYALDGELNFLVEPPMRGEDAPAFVMTPEIGLTLWYEPTAISEDKTAYRHAARHVPPHRLPRRAAAGAASVTNVTRPQ